MTTRGYCIGCVGQDEPPCQRKVVTTRHTHTPARTHTYTDTHHSLPMCVVWLCMSWSRHVIHSSRGSLNKRHALCRALLAICVLDASKVQANTPCPIVTKLRQQELATYALVYRWQHAWPSLVSHAFNPLNPRVPMRKGAEAEITLFIAWACSKGWPKPPDEPDSQDCSNPLLPSCLCLRWFAMNEAAQHVQLQAAIACRLDLPSKQM